MPEAKRPGLYANINAKRKRIENGSGETMRTPGSPGAPTERAFRKSALTAKPVRRSRAGAKKAPDSPSSEGDSQTDDTQIEDEATRGV